MIMISIINCFSFVFLELLGIIYTFLPPRGHKKPIIFIFIIIYGNDDARNGCRDSEFNMNFH